MGGSSLCEKHKSARQFFLKNPPRWMGLLMLPFLAVLLHVPLMRFVPLAHTLFPFGAESSAPAATAAAVHAPVYGAARDNGVSRHVEALFLNSSCAGAECLTLAAMPAAVHTPVCGAASNDGVSRLAAAHCAGSHCPTRCGGEALRAAQRVVAVAGTTGGTGGTGTTGGAGGTGGAGAAGELGCAAQPMRWLPTCSPS